MPEKPATRPLLERAWRSMPGDMMIALRLALARLHEQAPADAASLFAEITARYDLADAWLGLAASELQAGQIEQAAHALQNCLSRHVASDTAWQLTQVVAQRAGRVGWCGIDAGGWLRADGRADIRIDGVECKARWAAGKTRIPPGDRLEVTRNGEPLLGSPIDLAAIRAVEGFVEVVDGGLSGWAWHPADPDRDPVITIIGDRAMTITPTALWDQGGIVRPLARPRQFTVAADALPPGPVRVIGADGCDLLGSPLDPSLEQRAASQRDGAWAPVWADIVGRPATVPAVIRPVDVVVPVYGARGRDPAQTLVCLDSVIATLPQNARLVVVDDCSPDPALVAALQLLAKRRQIRLIRQPANRGYPAAVNAGMQAAGRRDVVLLNSDTLVPPGWLEALAQAARSAPGIGTACPLSNEATILSYPTPGADNPMPDRAGTKANAALAARANGVTLVDIPVAVGFCMFIRRECLDQVGLFREDLFAQGYGEESDFCMRARHHGWRHVAVTGMFVAHQGGATFGLAQSHLKRRNAKVLARLHPGYDAMIAAWIARDPLAPARRQMDALRWRAGRQASAVVLVTHAGGGGVDRLLDLRIAALQDAGMRAIVLRPHRDGVVVDGGANATPNLYYAIPAGLDALARLLRPDRPAHVEFHHMLGHNPALLGLPALLRVPHEIYVHDYAWFCPRIALVQEHAYCGEPALDGCEACVADFGSHTEEPISVTKLVERSAKLLATSRRVAVPAADVASRLVRHFPALRVQVTPWEDDGAIPEPPMPRTIRRICLIGGIGVEKGYEVLLACLRDVAKRNLPLEFTLVGHTRDDDRLLGAGPINMTGRYDPDEVEMLIRAQGADIALLPSIWPETWCFTLGHAWRAGLRAVVFDLGAPAERVRNTGWGWVLPLGLPAAALNDWMLRLDTVRMTPPFPSRNGRTQIQASSRQRNAVI
jgi:GT2 family glycosyltransferase/glycosyltransferase involved in cell wall biosynthesis